MSFRLHLPIGEKWRKIEENTMFSVKSTDFYRIFAIKPWIYKYNKEMSKVKGNQRKKHCVFLCTGVHQYQKCSSLFNITNYSAKVYQPV